MAELITITVDGIDYQVSGKKNLLETCLELGLDLSYFCWHPSLGSVGSCRQCAVMVYQDSDDQRGRLTMACMTPVSPNMLLSLGAKQAKDFRATNIEALMTNHPHDCPVCEEGGDCHLQDMTLMSEHIIRRFEGDKRTHNNQYLGPLVNHEMNRCIGCYRCVRFYRDYCNDDDLNVFGSKNQVYFGRAKPGVLESDFSGNLCEVCPTGVFTDKTFSENYCRKWDLQSSPTICQHCSLGCNTYTGSYNKTVRKISNRHNKQINGHFLCDKGRYSYQYANSERRTATPLLRNKNTIQSQALEAADAQATLHQWLTNSKGSIAALGSSRSSIENNVALSLLIEQYGGQFYSDCSENQLSLAQQQITFYQQQRVAPCTLAETETETADCTLIIGEDVVNSAPRLALCLRQMVRNQGLDDALAIGIAPWQDQAVRNLTQQLTSPLFIVSATPSTLCDVATYAQPLLLDEQQQLLTQIKDCLSNKGADNSDSALAQQIATALRQAKRPLLVYGNSSGDLTIQALIQDIYGLLSPSKRLLYYVLPNANSQALAIISPPNHSLDALITRLNEQPPTLLIILESDLDWLLSPSNADRVHQQTFDAIEHVVVIDHLMTATAKMADLLLPSASAVEQQGCWLNSQGLLQLSQANMSPSEDRKAAWQWCQDAAPTQQAKVHAKEQYQDLLSWCGERFELLSPIVECQAQQQCEFKLARQSFRASGRTAINAKLDVKEYPPASDELSHLKFSMEGVAPFRQINTDIKTASGAYIWLPKWNSGQAINKGESQQCGTKVSCAIFPGPVLVTPPSHSVQPQNQPSADFTLVSQYRLYDNNELSQYCPSLEQLMSTGSLSLNQHSADRLQWQPGHVCSLSVDQQTITLACHINPDCPDNSLLVDGQSLRALASTGNQLSLAISQISMHAAKETSS